MQNFDHNIGFGEKRQLFCRKLSKIAENFDHNIDPRSHDHFFANGPHLTNFHKTEGAL
jgi:hypothetical protein